MISSPESTNFNKLGNKVTGDMKSDKGLQATDADTADESSGSERVIGGGGDGGDLVVIQLNDGGMNADGEEEIPHDVAHAAGGSGEDDNWMF